MNLFDVTPKIQRKLNVLPKNPETPNEEKAVNLGRFPSWLHRKLPQGGGLAETAKAIGSRRLSTVCEEARCPNLQECWSKKTATFLVLGSECTRSCGFCDIDFSKNPKAPEEDEPLRVAESVKELGLKHVVITMVARDDLADGGAAHLSAISKKVRELNPGITLELLTSDFHGSIDSWKTIMEIGPEIFNYNLETVRSLTPRVRHKATYDRTLAFLDFARKNKINPRMKIKSGLMVGLGETDDEVKEALHDLKNVGVDIVTIGHYLQPNKNKLRVKAFITPEQFNAWEKYGLSIGIPHLFAGPFVRSSYNADLFLDPH